MAPVTVVVIPARDEARTIAACLTALAHQTVGPAAFEIIIVADACSDDTETVARAAAQRLGLTVTVLQGPGAGSGPARRLGMDAAAARLEALGCSDGLIATTDADSTPAEDWLARQLAHLARGATVVAGLIELDPKDVMRLPAAVRERRERRRAAAAGRCHRLRSRGRASSLRGRVIGGDRADLPARGRSGRMRCARGPGVWRQAGPPRHPGGQGCRRPGPHLGSHRRARTPRAVGGPGRLDVA